MILILIGVVLFIVGALMTLKPYTYWALGHISKPDAEPPGEGYLKFIRISGLVVILIALLLSGLSVWPRLSGQEVKISSGENWEISFKENDGITEMKSVSAGTNALPYDAAADGEYIYFLGWEMKDGVKTGQPGIYKVPVSGDFAGEAECLAILDKSAGDCENLQYAEGKLFWLQQAPATEDDSKMVGTAVYQLDLAGGEPELACMLTQDVSRYAYYNGVLYLAGGAYNDADIWQWDGEESSKLVKNTLGSEYPLAVEDGWMGTVTKKRDAIIRRNLDDGEEMELKVSLKPDGIWANGKYTLFVTTSGQTAAVCHEGREAKQYVLKDAGENGLLQRKENLVWQFDGKCLTVYNMDNLTYQEAEVPFTSISSMKASEDGTVVFCGENETVFYVARPQ